MANVLIIVTSADRLPNGDSTGLWLEEFAVPYNILRGAGHEIEVASPKGGAAPIDPRSTKSEPPPEWADAQHRLQQTRTLDGLRAEDFDAVFIPGGHGTMFDFPGNRALAQLVGGFHASNKLIASVCHGPAAFVDVVRKDGRPLVEGLTLTAFSDVEEKMSGLSDQVPFYLSERLREQGGHVENGLPMLSHVREDGNLITGQNPKSSEKAAQMLAESLARR